jgi:hypothetical protein
VFETRCEEVAILQALRQLTPFGVSDVGSHSEFNVRLDEQFLRALRMSTKLPIIRRLCAFNALIGLNDILLWVAKVAVTVPDVHYRGLQVNNGWSGSRRRLIDDLLGLRSRASAKRSSGTQCKSGRSDFRFHDVTPFDFGFDNALR